MGRLDNIWLFFYCLCREFAGDPSGSGFWVCRNSVSYYRLEPSVTLLLVNVKNGLDNNADHSFCNVNLSRLVLNPVIIIRKRIPPTITLQ